MEQRIIPRDFERPRKMSARTERVAALCFIVFCVIAVFGVVYLT